MKTWNIFDLRKASDTIDHTILINKLSYYALSIIESYLSNRKQSVSALGEISEQPAVVFGRPGKLPWSISLPNLYIHDLSNICKYIGICDDTNIFGKGKSKQEVYIDEILEQLYIYTMLIKLHANLQKSCLMYFTKTSSNVTNDNDNHEHPQIMIGPTKIKRVFEIIFLTVINKKLSWDAHLK